MHTWVQISCGKKQNIEKLMDASKVESCDSNLVNAFKFFKDEISELYIPKEVSKIETIPEPLDFYRNYVAPNIPVLIKGAIKNWEALRKWDENYFRRKLGKKLISVAVTPNGYADAITEVTLNGVKKDLFVLPEERLMTINEFYEYLNISDSIEDSNKGVFYIQKQNSNLTEEYPELLPDIDSNLLWATETFGANPTAINLWIGDKKAVTTLHKDPFENIYCVVSGYKDFILLPPTDRPWLPYKKLPVGQYAETMPGRFEIREFESSNWKFKVSDTEISSTDSESDYVPWIAIDPCSPDFDKYPLYKNANPLHVRVEEGDALYLPSLWFHHVKQSHKCIAVNYWYDMNLDIKYAYFQLIDRLSKQL